MMHGNLKSDESFYPTFPAQQKPSRRSGTKAVVESVDLSVGGIMEACYPGQLLQYEEQVSNYKCLFQ